MVEQIVEKYKNIVNNELGLDINNSTRKREYCEARGLYYTLLRNTTNLSLHHIAKTVNKDHSTVVYSLNQFPMWIKHNKMLAFAYDNAKQKINNIKEVTDEDDIIKLKHKLIKLNFEIFELKKQINNNIEKVNSKRNKLVKLINKIPINKEDKIIDRLERLLKMYY